MTHLARPQVREIRERYSVLKEVEVRLELPMFVLSFIWAALLIVELTWGLNAWLETIATIIWIVFVAEFAIRFVIAPNRVGFLRKNWLSVFALAIPALRVFRLARAIRLLRYGRAVRGLTLARVLTAFNRGLQSLRQNMSRFGLSYVLGLTALVAVLGTTGMYAVERSAEGGLRTWADALWFTAMLLTTSGSDYWPKTPEGRLLCFLIALYAFAIFGYVTATIAAWLMGRNGKPPPTSVNADAVASLRVEIASLQRRLDRIAGAPDGPPSDLDGS